MKKENIKQMPDYFDRYINLANSELTLLEALKEGSTVFLKHKQDLEKFQDYQYQEGKWTPKDVLQHVIDTERIMCYRALAFSRNEQAILPGYDENSYAKYTNAKNRSITDLLKEFEVVRTSNILMFEQFTTEMFHRKGICFKSEISTLALGFLVIGHAQHHLNVLIERYFNAV